MRQDPKSGELFLSDLSGEGEPSDVRFRAPPPGVFAGSHDERESGEKVVAKDVRGIALDQPTRESAAANPVVGPNPEDWVGRSAEHRRLKSAITQAMDSGEPDSLYYEFQDQIWDAYQIGELGVFEHSDLMRFLSLWWDGRNDGPDERTEDC